VVDAAGEVVWYRETRGGANGSVRRASGTFLMIDEGQGLLEVTPAGRVLAEVAQDSAQRRIHHDVLETASGSVLLLAQEWGEGRGTSIAGEAVWEWTPETGALRKRWSVWDHLHPERDWGALSVPHDWLHANAISRGARGNLLMSFHYLNQVISIAPGYGGVEWRLGGVNATITLPDAGRFTGQHTAAEIQPDRVLLFDNGFERVTERYSRALELQLDRASGTATALWEWRPSPDIWSRIVGSARRLPDGSTLVAFGAETGFVGSTGPVSVHELDADGQVRWRLTVNGVPLMYRAWPLADIAGEATPQ
jgi:hypothetical protein